MTTNTRRNDTMTEGVRTNQKIEEVIRRIKTRRNEKRLNETAR